MKKSVLVFLLLFCFACVLFCKKKSVFIDNPICPKGESLCVTRTRCGLMNIDILYLYANTISCKIELLLPIYITSRHVIESGDWFQKVWHGAPENGRPSSDSSCNVTQNIPFQVLGLWFDLKELFFLDFGLPVTEINIKKSTETRK